MTCSRSPFFLTLNGKFNDKWLKMWYDKLVRRCEGINSESRKNHYVIEYIDKNKFLCIKILKGDDGLANELQDGNQSYTGADNEDQ